MEKACGLHCTKINNISVKIGKDVILKDVNIHIHCGELTVIIGRNGAGKTTLLKAILDDTEVIKAFAKKVYTEKDMFFLGRGTDYNVALEGSLKLKEISYIHSEAYAAGELKHGPIALIENGVTVIGIITNPNLLEKSISNLQEVITRGAKTLIITNQILPNGHFDYVINIPETNPLISPILSVMPMLLLAFYISKQKGLDVDKPRNLAKSVTVE